MHSHELAFVATGKPDIQESSMGGEERERETLNLFFFVFILHQMLLKASWGRRKGGWAGLESFLLPSLRLCVTLGQTTSA